MKKQLAAILWLQLSCELRVYWKGNHGGQGIVIRCSGVGTRFSVTHLRFPGEELDYRNNWWAPPSEMFSLDRVKCRGESGAKASIPEHPGGRSQYHLLQSFNHCFRQTALVLTGSGEEPGISVLIVVKWGSEAEGKSNSLPWYQSPSQHPAHHSLPAWPLCHLLLCRGCTGFLQHFQSVPKPAAAAPAHPLLWGLQFWAFFDCLASLPSRKILRWMKKKNGVLTLIFFIVEIFLKEKWIPGGRKQPKHGFLRIWSLIFYCLIVKIHESSITEQFYI